MIQKELLEGRKTFDKLNRNSKLRFSFQNHSGR